MALPERTRYGLTKYQLMDMMVQRQAEGLAAIDELGGSDTILDHLHTNMKTGIHSNFTELDDRKFAFGMNFIPPVPPKSFIALAFEALQDKTLIILMVAAVVSIILGVTVEEQKEIAWIDGAAIFAAVVIVVFVTAINDWTKERQFRGLQRKLDTDSRFSVRRDGTLIELPLAELVVGDIAEFKYGNTFPVDGILLLGYDVKVDESSLTGEGDLAKKGIERDRMLYAGTQVMEGGGSMLVTGVGPYSQQGQIFQLLSQRSEEDAGFITLALRKLKRRCCGCCAKPVTVEEEEGAGPRQTVKRCSPEAESEKALEAKRESRKTSSSSDTEESADEPEEDDELTGIAKLNVVKVMKRRKQRKERKREQQADSPEVSSGSLLQKKLNKLAIQIGYGGTIAAVVCILILIIKFCIEQFGIIGRAWDPSMDYSRLLHFVIIGVTVLVVAVPEGLPLAVTIALAFSVKKMLRDHNLVRHLHACETMGNATSICSDKTGTLTTNRMTVVESYFAGTKYDVTPDASDLPQVLFEVLQQTIAINSSYTSKLIVADGPEDEDEDAPPPSLLDRVKALFFSSSDAKLGKGLAKQVGNVTECALLGLLVELGIDYEAIRDEHSVETFTKVYTFNSARKSMSTVIPLPSGGYRLLCKGAAEIVLGKCTTILGENGRIAPLSAEDMRDIVEKVVDPMASNSLRTICLAYRDFLPDARSDGAGEISSAAAINWDDEEGSVSCLTCIGVVGLQDPVRPEVPGCIESCQRSGITVRMVTGDNIATARAIAVKCGIIPKNPGSYLVLEGKEFNKRIQDKEREGQVSQKELDRTWPSLRVLARSTPQDKYTLVDGIIRSRITKNREVVAVTGDGTNDGPALKRADVGFAMGIAGTDVAKEASDIILTDDNFASIVKAVQWGRNVYDSISKFLQFQLTVNIVAVTFTLISAVIINDAPLRAIQLLWVNLIMDTFASLALATEAPTPDLLKRKPYGRNRALISGQMWLFLLGHSLYQLTVLLVILFAGARLFNIDEGTGRGLRDDSTEHFTMLFNVFVIFQIFNEVNARKIHGEKNVFKGIFTNIIFLSIMAGQVAVQIIITQFGDIVFGTSGLTLDLWLWCIFLGSTELVVGQLLLLIPVDKLPHFSCRRKGAAEEEFVEDEPDGLYDDNKRARHLWVKSLSRLRTQIRVVNAFRSGIESGSMVHLARLPHYSSTPRVGHHSRPIVGMETAV